MKCCTTVVLEIMPVTSIETSVLSSGTARRWLAESDCTSKVPAVAFSGDRARPNSLEDAEKAVVLTRSIEKKMIKVRAIKVMDRAVSRVRYSVDEAVLRCGNV